jgi:flagellar hook assembly protein FlgD
VEEAATEIAAAGTHVAANYPNPFNPKTTLPFSLAAPGHVRLAIFDVAGRLQRTLVDAQLPAGEHWVNWDGRDEAGSELASGVYFSRFEAGATSEVRKLLLLR